MQTAFALTVNLIAHFAIRFAVWTMFVGLGIAMQAIYIRLRRQTDAEHVSMWVVPAGGWIVAAILAIVATYFVFVLTRDPLVGAG